jgi:hypothetical protein
MNGFDQFLLVLVPGKENPKPLRRTLPESLEPKFEFHVDRHRIVVGDAATVDRICRKTLWFFGFMVADVFVEHL